MKNSSTKKLAISALAAIALFTACNSSPYPGYEKSESGLYSKFYTHDEKGVKPQEGDMVKLTMYYKSSSDSVLWDSKNKKMNQNPDGTVEFPVGKSSFKGSFEEALTTMSVGDSASFIISADSVYKKTFGLKCLPKYVDTMSMLTFEVVLKKITAKAEVEKIRAQRMKEREEMIKQKTAEEAAKLQQYIAEKKITAKPTASGIYYIEKTKGKGAKPTAGCTVKVNYTGMLLDGTIFDTSDPEAAKKAGIFNEKRPYEPIEFPLGQQQVIPGWEEGLLMMSAGAKGTLIIPSAMAYGDQGGGPIPPFSSLVFEVELVSFSVTPPQTMGNVQQH